MGQDMDRMCSTIIVAAAVVLFCMAYLEMIKMRARYSGSGGTCGMKATVQKAEATSAKQATFSENKTGKKDSSYMTWDEPWPVEDVACKHEEMSQDEPALKEMFGEWSAGEDVNDKFESASVNKEKAKVSANTRPISIDTLARSPTNAKNIGLPGLRESAGLSTSHEGIQFSDSCVEFNQSDSYVAARLTQNKSCGSV